MSETAEHRVTLALIEADAQNDGFPDYSELARAAIKEMRAIIGEAMAEGGEK